jgi:fimbrial chaperone protein
MIFRRRASCRLAAAVCAGASSWALSSAAVAGSFQVTPVQVSVSHDRPVSAITIKNNAQDPVSIRVVTYRWSQQQGEDVYTEANDVLVSPPIFTIAPDKAQVVRVGLRKAGSEAEASYRIFLEEIPNTAVPSQGIRTVLRLNLPFYKMPKAQSAANVRWTAARLANGEIELRATNQGALHDQINRIDVAVAGEKVQPLVEKAGVVLPGSMRIWRTGAARAVPIGTHLNLVVVRPSGSEMVEAIVQDSR